MTLTAFDTLKYARALESAGVSRKHAEAQAEVTSEVLSEMITEKLVTKDDLKATEIAIRSDFKKEIGDLKIDTIKWMIGLFFTQIAFIFAIIGYFS